VPLCKTEVLFLLSKVPAMILQPHNDKVLSNVVANQEIHTQYGVVPELFPAHQQNIVPVIDAALRKH
jgi:N6-L-threonylcarbamoyladenine synthase